MNSLRTLARILYRHVQTRDIDLALGKQKWLSIFYEKLWHVFCNWKPDLNIIQMRYLKNDCLNNIFDSMLIWNNSVWSKWYFAKFHFIFCIYFLQILSRIVSDSIVQNSTIICHLISFKWIHSNKRSLANVCLAIFPNKNNNSVEIVRFQIVTFSSLFQIKSSQLELEIFSNTIAIENR